MTETEIESAIKRLNDYHLADLRKSGLSDATIARCGFFSEENPHKVAAWLNGPYAKARGPALVIPFRDLDGTLNGFKRVKPTIPRRDRNGREIKYESPRKLDSRAFIPPETVCVLNDSKSELLLVEGEKKAACCDQNGFRAVGLTGVWNWKLGKSVDRLIPDLEAIEWRGRKTLIVFDSDQVDKPEVREAGARLAAVLKNRGANVRTARLPDGPDGEKQGADDFLVRHGHVAFRKILDAADEPDVVRDAVTKIPASQVDVLPEARRFLDQIAKHADGSKLRFHHGNFWGWDGKRYRLITDDEMRAHLYDYLDPIATHIGQVVVSNLLAAIQSQVILRSDVESPCWLGKKPHRRNYIAMRNGIVDLDALLAGKDDVLLPHSPKWFSPVCLPYDYEPMADCPKWLEFLDHNLDRDVDRIAVLQEWFGYCLEPDTTLQKFLTLEGEGANGKSVVCAVLTATLGPENVSHVPLEGFGTRFGLMPTLNKLANIASEVGDLDRVAEGFLKQFVVGDRMSFEQKFKEPIMAVPTARLVLATNNRPRFSDRSSGLWRRMILLPMTVTISEDERVTGMDTGEWWQEQGELPGIFLWAVAGLLRLRQQGRFTDATVCREALDDYRCESNPARLFLAESCVENSLESISTTALYQEYREFCGDNGYRPLGEGTFGKEVRRVFPKVQRRRLGARGDRRHVYEGIGRNSTCGT